MINDQDKDASDSEKRQDEIGSRHVAPLAEEVENVLNTKTIVM